MSPARATTVPRDDDPLATAAFVADHLGGVLAYLDEVAAPDDALRAAGEAFAHVRARTADDEAAGPVPRLLAEGTRAAATRHAWGPQAAHPSADDPLGGATVPRLLVARATRTIARADDALLTAHLQECAACRATAAAFARAEARLRAGERVPVDGTAVGVVATAMAFAVPPPTAAGDRAPAPRRTAVPAPARRWTATGAAGTDAAAELAAYGHQDEDDDAPLERAPSPDDPTSPESMGYAVPRPGLPRPERGPAPRRRRSRRTASAAMGAPDAAVGATASGVPDGPPAPATASREPSPDVVEPPAPATATPAPRRPARPVEHQRGAATPPPATVVTGPSASGVPVRPRPPRGLAASPAFQHGWPAAVVLAVLVAALFVVGTLSEPRAVRGLSVPAPTLPAETDGRSVVPRLP